MKVDTAILVKRRVIMLEKLRSKSYRTPNYTRKGTIYIYGKKEGGTRRMICLHELMENHPEFKEKK